MQVDVILRTFDCWDENGENQTDRKSEIHFLPDFVPDDSAEAVFIEPLTYSPYIPFLLE